MGRRNKVTVIYSNFGDSDTKVLRGIWEGLDAEVIEVESRGGE